MRKRRLGVLVVGMGLLAPACKKSVDVDASGNETTYPGTTLPECVDGPDPGTHGPVMMHVGRLDGTCAWIDDTEVTRAQYAEFLQAASAGADDLNVAVCKSNNPSFEPLSDVDMTKTSHPIAGVDWCDAAAYCQWAGKALCGEHAQHSYFETVCKNGTDASFRPEEQFALTAGNCNGNSDATAAVKSKFDCVTPTDVFDLAGNVKEWTTECQGETIDGKCAYRGGSYLSKSGSTDSWGCEGAVNVPRGHAAADLGFRCCAVDPP